MLPYANFDIIDNESDDTTLVIRDRNDGHKTITNDAERVVQYLHIGGKLGTRRLFYYDTEGQRDEIVHDFKGHFIRIQPIKVE